MPCPSISLGLALQLCFIIHFLGDHFFISSIKEIPLIYDCKMCLVTATPRYLVNICIIYLCAVLMRVLYFQLTLILCCCFSPFGCLEDEPEIDDHILLRPLARLRWLHVLEGRNCVACRASPFIELPCQTSFCPVSIFLFVCFRRLSTLLPPLCVILVFTMCIRVLYCMCLKSHTYFYFFIRAR